MTYLEIHGGDNQWTLVGSTLPWALAVRVLDQHHQPVRGAAVAWAGGGSVGTSPSPSVTDARGIAFATYSVAEDGIHLVSAAADGTTSPRLVTFRARAVTAAVSMTINDLYRCVYYGDCTHSEFVPADVVVPVGRTVAWDWGEGGTCNVVFEDDPTEPTSSAAKTAGTHFRTFTAPGTYRYRCTLYSTSFTQGMVGTVTVQ